MKKTGIVLLALLLMFGLTACSSGEKDDGKADIVLITDLGTIDDKSFNQGSWEGVEQYTAENKDVTAKYVRPLSGNDNEYYNTIVKAIEEMGAKVLVTPGYLFNNAIFRAQADYPDVHFIFVDSEPQKDDTSDPVVGENTVSLLYQEEQAGFLAGYSAVKEGFTKLGFIGGIPVPAVTKFGIGYLYGANHAAKELGIDNIDVRWNYSMTFEPSQEVQQLASGWYSSGTEAIFVAAGGAGDSVFKAAEDAETVSYGVDSDQQGDSETVVASAVKQLQGSVRDALKGHFEGNFPGGQTLVYDIAKDSVGLATDFTRFKNFDKAQYDAIYADLKADKDGIASEIPTSHEGENPSFDLSNVTIVAN